MFELVGNANGAVGRTTPMRTGAISESAVSISSSMEIFISVRKTRRHICTYLCCGELKIFVY